MPYSQFHIRPRYLVPCLLVLIFLTSLQNSQAQESPRSRASTTGDPVAGTSAASPQPPLPRRAGPMGVRIDPQITDRVAVEEVVPGTPAATAGILAGDTISSVAGKPVPTFEALRSVMRGLQGGQATTVEVLRDGGKRTLEIQLAELREQVAGSKLRYGSVDVPKGYRLRTIVTVPENESRKREGRFPAFLYVQGIICDSIDRPEAPDAVDTRIVHTMAGQGFVTMRVDKPGLGDSEGPPCSEIGFQEELEGYLAALNDLAQQPEVDPSRIYVFGHSMGGVMTPFLAKEGKVRGSIVYGTIARTWFEYQLENVRRQSELAGASPADVAEAMQQQAKESAMILVEKKTLGDVWERWPELRQEPQGLMLDENHMSTRHMRFFHELQDINIARAWNDSKGAVLGVWGEYDWVASHDDHERIAAIVNARQADSGTVLTMPKADHAFTTHASMAESRTAMGQGQWDANLPKRILEWIDAVESGNRVAWADTKPDKTKPDKIASEPESDLPKWTKLTTEPYPGKQDDIYFVDPTLGFYGNGAGRIFRTTDGGATWQKVFEQKGTFVRCLAFTDDKHGVMGNIGPGYFPGVTDDNPLYRTEDGGATWSPVTEIDGDPVVGLCAFDIVQVPFVNAGNLDHRPRIIGVGRVGGPAAYIWSDDLGKTWKQGVLPEIGAMAFDVKFLDDQRGFIASATHADVAQSHALILATDDGGSTWREVYRSARPFEITWKLSFPSKDVGYCTIQSYNPDTSASARFVAKTTDGGKTWSEIPLVDDHRVRQFGVAFLDENIGWVGAMPHGLGTTDGGKSWSKVDFGNAVNKIRLIPSSQGVTGYAIGAEVYRMQIPAGATGKESSSNNSP